MIMKSIARTQIFRHRRIVAACAALTFSFFTLIAAPQLVHATSLASWDAGNIIDDGIFTNTSSMSAADIQQFLNSKVPTCDTNGTQTSEYGGGTRAQWGQAKYGQSTFTCLKDYTENGLTAAQIIYNTAQTYKINPQVLIVVLQKEQGLVTDTWPLNIQYRTATGYGCPDTAPCDSQYYGLTNQLSWTGKMYRSILNANPNWYTPYILGNNYVQYNPEKTCGGSTVNIQNRSTQALYNYTPYQPNQDALNAGYGTVYCGAYGNRNFYLYFNDWFGSTRAVNGMITISKALTVDKTTVARGDTVTASFEVSNSASYSVLAGGLGICARLNGQYYDFGFSDQNNIPANGKITLSYSKTVTEPGTLDIFTCSYHASIGGWASAVYPYNTNGLVRTLSLNVQDNPLITSNVSFSPTNPSIGQPVTASFTVRNTSANPASLGMLVLAARDPQGRNVDFPADPNLVIPANTTYTFSKTQTLTTAGTYSYFLANFNNNSWSSDYPHSASGITKNGTLNVQDNPLITSNVSFSPTNPSIGQPVTASFTVRNTSANPASLGMLVLAARDPQGRNVDFPADPNLVIPANTTYTFSKTQTFSTPGNYYFFLADFNNNNWSRDYPKSADGVSRDGTLKIN